MTRKRYAVDTVRDEPVRLRDQLDHIAAEGGRVVTIIWQPARQVALEPGLPPYEVASGYVVVSEHSCLRKQTTSSLSDWHFRRGLGRAAGDFGELRRPSRLDRLHSRLSGRSGVASEACSAGWDAWGTVRRGRGRGRTSA